MVLRKPNILIGIMAFLLLLACQPAALVAPTPEPATPSPSPAPTPTPLPTVEAFAADLAEAGLVENEVIPGANIIQAEWEKQTFEATNPGYILLIDKEATRPVQSYTHFIKEGQIIAFYLGIAPAVAEIYGKEARTKFGGAENPLFIAQAAFVNERWGVFANPWSNFSDGLYQAAVAKITEDGSFEILWARVDENGVIQETMLFWERIPRGFDVQMNTERGRLKFFDAAGLLDRQRSWQIWDVELSLPQVPQIEGLLFTDGKYYAEAENPYGLQAGAYAGEAIIYNQGEELGVVLVRDVVRVLLEQANTSEAIAVGNWKIPFPLDARGLTSLQIEVYKHPGLGTMLYLISGLSPYMISTSPFPQEAEVSILDPCCLDLSFPPSWKRDDSVLFFQHPEGSKRPQDRSAVSFGNPIICDIKGLVSGWGNAGIQLIITMSPSDLNTWDTEHFDYDMTDNILEIDGGLVFLAGPSKNC